jgi:thioredoxin 1
MTSFPTVNEDNFDSDVLSSAIPVMVEFGAEWCAPCKRMEPLLAQLAEQWAGKIRIYKSDVDESADLAMRFQVMGVPTMILFVNGQAAERLTGFQPKDRLVDKFGPFLG